MVTVEQVREVLKNLPEEYVYDNVIEPQIDIAEFIVDQEKTAAATDEQIEKAVLAWACYKTGLAYAADQERSLGVLSPQLNSWLDRLKQEAEMELRYVKRLSSAVNPLSYFDISDSLWYYMRKTYDQ